MIKIIHFSDLHFSKITLNPILLFSKRVIGVFNLIFNRKKSYTQNHLDTFKKFLKKENADYILITGDLTSTSLEDEFIKAKDFIDSCNTKTLLIPGNHDQYTKKAYKELHFYNYFKSSNSTFSKTLKDQKIEIHNLCKHWIYLGLDTCIPTSFFSCSGYFSEDLEKHLINVLEQIPKDKNIILANHFPAIHDAKKRKTLHRKEKLLEIIKKYPNIKLYLHGHTHKLSLEKITNNTYMAGAGCISYKKNATFNMLEIYDQKYKIINYHFENNNWQKKQVTEIEL